MFALRSSPFLATPLIVRRNQEAISETMHGTSLFPRRPIPALRLRRPRAEFQKHISVNKKDFGAVEYLLRKGHRQLEMYASPDIRNIH